VAGRQAGRQSECETGTGPLANIYRDWWKRCRKAGRQTGAGEVVKEKRELVAGRWQEEWQVRHLPGGVAPSIPSPVPIGSPPSSLLLLPTLPPSPFTSHHATIEEDAARQRQVCRWCAGERQVRRGGAAAWQQQQAAGAGEAAWRSPVVGAAR